MDPSEQGLGEHPAPQDQHSQDQNDASLQRQQAQQQQQRQQAQQVHVQPQQPRVLQQPQAHPPQTLPDRQPVYQDHQRQHLLHIQQQERLARADIQRRYGHAPNVMLPLHAEHPGHESAQPHAQAVAQQQHVVPQQPHPGMTRTGSSIMPSVATTGPASSSSTSKLWEHFVKGDKMQKTNKFYAHCIYCRKVNKQSQTRGERRMMSAHLSNCPEAPEEARAEGMAISNDLKIRRSLVTLEKKKSVSGIRGGPQGGVALSPGGKRRTRPPSLRSIGGPSGASASQQAMEIAAAAAAETAAHPQPHPGGTAGAPYFDANLGPPISLQTDVIQTGNITTTDNVRLYYEECGTGHPVILIHDLAGSCKYFESNFRQLSQNFRVIRFDLRGHGDSEKPSYGYHLHRLAADLRDVISHLGCDRVSLLGAGLGCSVMWAFVELYGQSLLSAVLFVNQSPYMMASFNGEWMLGSKRVFSEGSVAHVCAELTNNPRLFHEKNIRASFTRVPNSIDVDVYVDENMKAPSWFAAKLLRNHCHMDWRAVLPLVSCPALVIVGKKSRIFPYEGVKYSADHMPHAKCLAFEEGSHFLYIEEAVRFNSTVSAFLQSIVAGA